MHLLAQKLQPKTYSEHSSLYRSGSTGNTMFVMKSGSAQMFGENGEKYATFTSGMFFGETSPLMKVTRNFSVTITSESLIYELNLETIALINEKFPVMKERLDRTSHRSFFLWRIYELRKVFAPYY